ncbi:MAG: polymer-forming cytoskeletal protein [Pseudomonadota bacterium]
MNNEINLVNQDFSFLGKGGRVKGEFHLSGVSHIACELEGKLLMEKEMDLYIERDGKIKGSIECHNVEIHGHFDGILHASGKITVYPPAQLSGKVKSKDLVVYPGSVLDIEYHSLSPDKNDSGSATVASKASP